MTLFDDAMVRFGTSGTLILFYSLADHAARRSAADPLRARLPRPRWLGVTVFVSITAYYLCIKPYGGTLLGGYGNLIGIALCFAAMALRWFTRFGLARVRMPEVAARMAFYAALPLAVGVPLGWLTLTVPAMVATALVCIREDQVLLARVGPQYAERMRSSARWVPGIF